MTLRLTWLNSLCLATSSFSKVGHSSPKSVLSSLESISSTGEHFLYTHRFICTQLLLANCIESLTIGVLCMVLCWKWTDQQDSYFHLALDSKALQIKVDKILSIHVLAMGDWITSYYVPSASAVFNALKILLRLPMLNCSQWLMEWNALLIFFTVTILQVTRY